MRLLLAEDESMMAEAISAYLAFHGHQVDWAEDGLAALEMAESENYDCLILDIMMPKMDGIPTSYLLLPTFFSTCLVRLNSYA